MPKTPVSQKELDAIALRAQSLAIELSHLEPRIAVMNGLNTATAVSHFNQMVVACGVVNHKLLGALSIEEDRRALRAEFKRRTKK